MDILFGWGIELWAWACIFDWGGAVWLVSEIIEEESFTIEDELRGIRLDEIVLIVKLINFCVIFIFFCSILVNVIKSIKIYKLNLNK